jgi:dipeptidyl aminopeptidase/acylaminoacyl peptidase
MLMIHGGPNMAVSTDYLGFCASDPTSCHVAFLKKGYVVLQPNYHGSEGYGSEFLLSIIKDGDMGMRRIEQELLLGVDQLIEAGVVDPKNMIIGGASQGGYITMWMITQTDRFKAAISMAGVANLISHATTIDTPIGFKLYFNSPTLADFDQHLNASPIRYFQNVKTPLLLMCGDQDKRTPFSQSMEFYTALRENGKPVKMLKLPDEGHGIKDANLMYETTLEMLRWLDSRQNKHKNHN